MEMDIDMDIDLNLDVEDRMEDENSHEPHNHGAMQIPSQIALLDDPNAQQPAEPIPCKVHIRGLDSLSSADVKQYASEHYPLDQFVRIEWIDDTSANLVYAEDDAAQDALSALTDSASLNLQAIDISPLQLRPAKRMSTNASVDLFVRQATAIDVKKKGAHEASRYYLLNPDQDPRERKRAQERRPRGNWASDDEGDYNRRRFDDYEHKRRRNDESNAFSASMYDDDAGESPAPSASALERRKRARFGARNGGDLFPSRVGRSSDGRLRDRSASPARHGDGTMGFGMDDESESLARQLRQRTRSPDRLAAGRNTGKELFPSIASEEPPTNTSKELFPAKKTAAGGMRSTLELFPSKRQSFSNHRRKDAVDASGSDTAEFFANSTPPPTRERSLAERVTGRPSSANVDGIRIRGAAEEDVGISIRSAASSQTTVKELFPLKAGNNVGKELFGEAIKGRGGRRRKAEDMFS